MEKSTTSIESTQAHLLPELRLQIEQVHGDSPSEPHLLDGALDDPTDDIEVTRGGVTSNMGVSKVVAGGG